MQRDQVPHANDNAATASDRDPIGPGEPRGLEPMAGAAPDTLAATRSGRDSLLDAGQAPLEREDSTSALAGASDGSLDGGSRKLELLEEVPDVRVRRVPAGTAVLRKEVETRTETVELELRTETLVVRRLEATGDGTEPAPVEVDGRLLEPGEEARLVLFREEADVRKLPVVYERVSIERRDVAERESRPLELGRERLNVEVQGEAIVRDPGSTIDGRSSTTGRG